MTAAPPRPRTSSDPVTTGELATAYPLTRHRRLLRLAAVRTALRVRSALLPPGSVRRRQRLQVCGAARTLTALGVQVRVVQPDRPWPRNRACRLIALDPGWLGDLALVVAVPRTVLGWTVVTDRAVPCRPAGAPAGGKPAADEVLCPVAVRYRTAEGYLAADQVPRTFAEVVAVRGLVVEVQLLPARDPVGAAVRRREAVALGG